MRKQTVFKWVFKVFVVLLIVGGWVVACHSLRDIWPAAIAVLSYLTGMGLLCVLTRRLTFSLAAVSSFFLILAFLNQMKVHYYKEQLFFQDFYVLTDLANFETLLYYYGAGLGLFGLLLLIAATLYWVFKKETYILSKRGYLCAGGVALLTGALFGYLVTEPVVQRQWEQKFPGGQGVVANLAFSLFGQGTFQQPQFTESSDYFREKMASVTLKEKAQRPDIIVVLQESTVDPRIYNLQPVTPDLPKMNMFEPGETTKADGWLRVQTYGGGTWLSEFALLTGLVSDDFGSYKDSVYYWVVPHLRYSLFKELKKSGYHTVVLSPFNKSAYRSGEAYQEMGVDEILQPQDLGYPASKQKNLWRISSAEVYHYVQEVLRTRTDKPLFIFALTMNEHGPYESTYPVTYRFSKDSEAAQTGKMNHYLSKIIELNAATEQFSHFVQQRKKPTLFLGFGDHQPGLDWKGGYQVKMTKPHHITYFHLQDNLSLPPEEPVGKITDISLLGGLILERIGAPVSAFYQANIAMRHLCQGGVEDCQDSRLLQSYKRYLYHDLQAAGE